jgi:hypothetical protein
MSSQKSMKVHQYCRVIQSSIISSSISSSQNISSILTNFTHLSFICYEVYVQCQENTMVHGICITQGSGTFFQVHATFLSYWMLNLGPESRPRNRSYQCLTNAAPNTHEVEILLKYGSRCSSTNLIGGTLQKMEMCLQYGNILQTTFLWCIEWTGGHGHSRGGHLATRGSCYDESEAEEAWWEVPTKSSLSWTCTFSSIALISTYFRMPGFLRTKSSKIGLELLVID